LFGAGVPGGPLSPALETWALPTSDFDCYNHDVDAAKALLAEAGLEMPVKISINVLPRQDIKDIAQVAQQQLEAGGFEVELLNQEIGAFVQDWKNSNFDIFASVNGGQPDPDGYFYRTFHTGGSTNVFKYEDAEIDAWLDEGRSETNTATRKEIYDNIQRKLACEGPINFIAYGDLYTAVNDAVHGYEIYANGRLTSLVNVTMDE
jgi:peptide/nickel transport system substrate-binding protein